MVIDKNVWIEDLSGRKLMDDIFVCRSCRKKSPFAYIDGYSFGDILLEGIIFKIDKDFKCLGVKRGYEDYIKKMDWQFWKNECNEYCKNIDVVECPVCGEDIYIERNEK